jgi:spore maturation protein CgeB
MAPSGAEPHTTADGDRPLSALPAKPSALRADTPVVGARMRIFYASSERPNQALPTSHVWRDNLFRSLVSLGHDVVEFDYELDPLLRHADVSVPANRAFVDEHRPQAEAALLDQLEAAQREGPIDLFFSYFYSVCATPPTIHRIREMGIVTMNWYCNGSYQFDLVAEVAPAYDFSLVPEEYRLADYRRIGANPIYCQEAANPDVYHPVAVERDLDVVFVGARYGERSDYIKRLVEAGIAVRVFGPGWQVRAPAPSRTVAPETATHRLARRLRLLSTREGWRRLLRRAGIGTAAGSPDSATTEPTETRRPRLMPADGLPDEVCGPPLSDEDMVAMYSRAKISLGFSTVGRTHLDDQRIVQVRLRDFEATMSGAFYIVEDMPELRQFYEVGDEVVTYLGADDLVDKCRYYLEHEDERERIRLAGHARALRDHTWQQRFRDVFREAGLPDVRLEARGIV